MKKCHAGIYTLNYHNDERILFQAVKFPILASTIRFVFITT